MPSLAASLSAMSPSMSPRTPAASVAALPTTEVAALQPWARKPGRPSHAPSPVVVGLSPPDVAVGIRFLPSEEVLSMIMWASSIKFGDLPAKRTRKARIVAAREQSMGTARGTCNFIFVL